MSALRRSSLVLIGLFVYIGAEVSLSDLESADAQVSLMQIGLRWHSRNGPQETQLPGSLTPSPNFTVTVDGIPQMVYMSTAIGYKYTHSNASFFFVHLDEGSSHRIEITTASPFQSAALRPRAAISLESDNHTKVAFDLRKAGNFILELDGSHEFQTLASGLMIFADYKEAPRPSTLYFGPGVHILPSDNKFGGDPVMWLKNDTIVHIDAGAVVLGYIRAHNARNITIRGRGILASSFLPGQAVPTNQLPPSCDNSNAWKRPYYHSSEAIRIENCSDVTLDGITIVHGISWNIAVYATNKTYVRGVKIISWRCMSDGMDFDSSENVLVEQCFIRSNDDAIAIKGENPSFDSRNIMIRDNVLWGQALGNCMEIGVLLFNGAVENITFLRNVCFQASRASMSIHDCGHAAVRNILFQDNVVEAVSGQVKFDEDQGMQLIDLHIACGQRMTKKTHMVGSIANVRFVNITYNPNKVKYLFSRIRGNSSEHKIENLTFSDFKIGSKLATSLSDLNASSAFLENVTFG